MQIIDISGSENPQKTNRLLLGTICLQSKSIWINLALVFARIWTDICSIFGFWHVIPDGWFFWADFCREGVETDCSKCEKWVFQTFLHRYRWSKIFLWDFLIPSSEFVKKIFFYKPHVPVGGGTLKEAVTTIRLRLKSRWKCSESIPTVVWSIITCLQTFWSLQTPKKSAKWWFSFDFAQDLMVSLDWIPVTLKNQEILVF